MDYAKVFLMSVLIVSSLKEVSLKGMEYSLYGERYRIVYFVEQHGGHGNVPLCTDFYYNDKKFNLPPSQEKMVAESSCVDESTLNNLIRLRNNHQSSAQAQATDAAQRKHITQAIILPEVGEVGKPNPTYYMATPVFPIAKNTPPPVRQIRQ